MTHLCRTSIAALTAVACFACSEAPPEEVESHAPVPVRVAPAELRALTGVVHATAIVTPAPGAELAVSAPEPARIIEMPKAEGASVRRGDLLVRFEIPSLTADVDKQRAEIARARARIENARAAAERARQLFERGVAARKEVEDAARESADAEADLATAESASRAARTSAGRTEVRATFDGIVARRAHNPGDLVEPGSGEPILRVIDPAHLELVAAVAALDAVRIHPGAAAHAAGVDVPGLRVVAKAAAVQPGTGTVSVRVAIAGRTALPVGLAVPVTIDTETVDRAVVVPRAALVHEDADTFVFVVAGGKASRRQVSPGLETDALTQVSGAIAPGDVVVVDGQNGLPDGAAVQVSGAAGVAKDQAMTPPAEHP